MNRASLALAVAAMTTSGGAQTPEAPRVSCLAPRAASCVPHTKKDPDARATSPALRSTVATLFNVHTHEAVALGATPEAGETGLLARFFRDRTSWETHAIDASCVATLRLACTALGGTRVEVVSAYRSDKLNEMLRKKGHHVARHSQHVLGRAIDFRIVGVPGPALVAFVRRMHHGGVGVYPESGFVHVDAGAPRTWAGE